MMKSIAATLLLLVPVFSHADERYTVTGLEKPAEIVIDDWGVPHIYAKTHYDTFFVQGFNAARDRLWQIDLWRRRGLGELSGVLGPAFVEQDKAARLFLYRGSMFREWLAYGNDAKRIAEAFTAGINAYVQLTRDHPDMLPLEFKLLGYQPALWRPADTVRIRSNGLWRNVTSEAHRARVVCQYGLHVDALRKKLQPPWQTGIPQGLDPCEVPADVTRLYSLAKAPVDFSRAVQFSTQGSQKRHLKQALDGHTSSDLVKVNEYSYIQLLKDVFTSNLSAGSNNWSISPSHTATGRPILANDPHRSHAVPSLRYVAHLSGPGIDVIGAGEPALPGISIGHNERIAFGLTIFSIDQEDLMVYKTDGDKYWYRGEWRPMRVLHEAVAVKGSEPLEITLRFTVHGPVIYQQGDKAFAVQAAWLQPGMAPYFGSVEYMRARNWREFLGALNRWGAPSENQVYADVDGNIGYKPAGLTPIRDNYDGLLPVPGDGRYEWQGFYDMDALPVAYNPERGWVATANAMSLPRDYPYKDVRPGFEWAAPWRIDRIGEVLSSDQPQTLQASIDLQRDYLSIPARRILEALDVSRLPSPAPALFQGWDYRLARDSGAAALFEIWWSRYLKQAVMRRVLDLDDVSGLGNLDGLVVVESLEVMKPDQRQRIANASIKAAIDDARSLMGDDADKWTWGTIHHMKFEHPLYDLVDDKTRKMLAIPVVSRGGSGDTPNATHYDKDFNVTSGASWRMVLDVGNWDNAFMTNAPGQSGNPESPHYDDMLDSWANDGSLPLLYSREAVEKHAQARIELVPASE